MKHDMLNATCHGIQCRGMIVIVAMTCSILLFQSCAEQAGPSPPPDMKWVQHSKPTPLQPTELTQDTINQLKRCNTLADFSRFDKYIPLQGTIVGDLTQLIRIKDFFFVLDRLQSKVFKFDLEGKFIKEIGKKGQGPGEFEVPSSIRHAFDQNLAIYDGLRGRIIVLDLDGKFVTDYALMTKQGMIIPGSNFIWDKPDRLILGAFASDKETGPWHVILERKGKEFGVVTGFGERFEPLVSHRLGTKFLAVFCIVGENIWVGSPYGTSIDVYNKVGVFLNRIGSKVRPNGITKEHFDSIPNNRKKAKEYLEGLRDLDWPRGICVIGDLVVVTYRETLCVFDYNGNVIRDYVGRGKMFPIYEAFGKEVYSPQIVKTGKALSQVEIRYLVDDLGVDFNKTYDLNPFIRVGVIDYE